MGEQPPRKDTLHGNVGRLLAAALLVGALVSPAPAGEIRTTRHQVQGLSQDVEILVDRWGVPHVYAKTTYDVFFGQGFNAARDRLWQIDLWRKRGLGLLARDFGPAFVEQDLASRLFLFRGDMRAEWIAYASDTKRIVESFVAGVNAYVSLVRQNPALLPPEFALLGYQPDFWDAADIVRLRSHGLARNVLSEVARARTIAAAGLEVDAFRQQLEPPWQTRVPDGLNPAEIPDDVLRLYALARDPVRFTPGKLKGETPPGRTGMLLVDEPFSVALTESNNFAISPAKSATGRALLANDPHRVHGVPSLRYLAHLSAPGIDVVGAGEPFLPGVSLGHNRTIAFGLTIFAIDQEDLYVYETNPASPDEYRYKDRWEPMTLVRESIPVKGAAPRDVTLKFTRHGPVIYEDASRHRAYALRAAWLQPGAVPYMSSLEYLRASNWDEFIAAMNRHCSPPLNYLFADASGNIGWAPSGLAPVRPNWDGLLPVPGDGRYEWAGYRTADELPRALNMKQGWFGTSNEMNVPLDSRYAQLALGFEWADPSRAQRQPQIFDRDGKLSVQDVIAAQTDVTSVLAQRATSLLAGLSEPSEPALASALRTLRNWDHRATRESVGAAIYNAWFHGHLCSLVVARVVPPPAVKLVGRGHPQNIMKLLEQPDARLGPVPREARDRLLLDALRAAVEDLTRRMGPDQAHWQWGRLHHAHFEHPLSVIRPPGIRAEWNVGPIGKAGDAETLGRSAYRIDDYRLVHGASARFVSEVGNWSNTWATNSPGQSGDPRSRHYRDLFEDWAHDRYFPLLFDRRSIEEHAEERIMLVADAPSGTVSR